MIDHREKSNLEQTQSGANPSGANHGRCHLLRRATAGAAEECQSSSAALRRAEIMSRSSGNIGAVAFSRTGDPMMGEFNDARLLQKFGNVPDDLGGL